MKEAFARRMGKQLACTWAINTPSEGKVPPTMIAPMKPSASHGQSSLFSAHSRLLRELADIYRIIFVMITIAVLSCYC